MKKPLEGIRIVELGTYVAVPKCARILSDWGADVIKIESLIGDEWRNIGKGLGVTCKPDNNPLYHPENMNKRNLALNLKTPEGLKILMELIETADIFVTNSRVRSLEKMGLDYASLQNRFPKLIYGLFTGYGQKGPDKDRPGFDVAAFWTKGGMPVEWTVKGHPPFKPQPGFGDSACASMFLAGLLAALFSREKTGKGDFLEISLFGAALWFNSTGVVSCQPQYGRTFPRGIEDCPAPYNLPFQTKDGDWIMWSLPNWDKNARYKDLLRSLDMEEYINDPRFASLKETGNHRLALREIFEKKFLEYTTQELVRRLTEGDFVFSIAANPKDVIRDEQAWANGFLKKIKMEDGEEVIFPTNPVQFASFTPDFNLAAPLGRDTKGILTELGYGAETIDKLVESQVAKAVS